MKNDAARIAVCDDRMLIRVWLQEHLRDEGYQVAAFENGGELLHAMEEGQTDLVFLGLRLSDGPGVDVLSRIKESMPDVPVIMITARGELETAVEAVHAGAAHFLEKPPELAELLLLIDKALESRRPVREGERFGEGNRWELADITVVGRSFAVRWIAEVVTRSDQRGSAAKVLIRSESGVGKDVVASAIHARRLRRAGLVIPVSCTAPSETSNEGDLFGRGAGASTDAREEKLGHTSLEVLETLEAHDQPGSARQLRAVLERILLLLDDRETIELSSPPLEPGRAPAGEAPEIAGADFVLPADGVNLDDLECGLLRQALERTGGNKTRAARLLGLSRDTVRYRVEKYGLEEVGVGSEGADG